MKSDTVPWARGGRRAHSFQRRMAWSGLVTILAMLVSLFPQVAGLPTPTAEAHNLQTRMVSMYMDSITQATLDARMANPGWSPPDPLLQSGDELGLIIKVVPRDGTTTGVGGHIDFYVPNGVQVMDVGYVVPDGAGGFTLVSMKGQSPIAIGDGPIGAKATTQLIGLGTNYTNILGVTEAPVVPASGLHRGTIAGVYGDTGIFYSTDPDTAYGSWQKYTGDWNANPYLNKCGSLAFTAANGKTLVNNSGDTVVPCNKWDAEQLMAWGVKGGTFGVSAPIVDYSDGRGNAPWGFASSVGGPQSGYAWNFNWDEWQASPKTAADMRNAMDPTEIGPWNRIKYSGSLIAKDQAGLKSTVLGYASVDGSNVGATVPLPATTSQTDNTSPKAIRWAVGQLTAFRPEYAWVKIKVISAAEITDPTGCPIFKGDTFGGDAGGTDNGKDHLWRYYEPTEVTWNGCLAAQKTASREIVKVGDTYQYKLKVYNLQNFTLSSVVVRDPILSGVTFISAVPAQNSGPSPLVWNVGTLLPGQKWEATVTVKATGSGFLDNCMEIDSGQLPTQTACDTTISGSYPYLVPSKSVTPTSTPPGGTVTYDVLVKNVGTGPTGNPVVISDFLPGGLTYDTSFTAVVTVNGAAVTNYTLNATNPSNPIISVPVAINGGSQLTLKFQAVVPTTLAAGLYCNSYSVTQNGVPITTGSEACLQIDAGTIGDTVFRDWNGNGTQDPEDEGLPGVTVNLYAGSCPPSGSPIKTTATDANGNYLFGGLSTPASYCVDVTPPAGYTLTTPPEPRTVSLAANETNLTADFGYKPGGNGSIGDKVFEDVDNNGVFGAGDFGIPNVTVWLYEDTNNDGVITPGADALVATTQSDSNGDYLFSGLATGINYLVKVDKNDGDIQAYFNAKYDPDPVPYQLSTVEIKPSPNLAGSDLDNDFGFWRVLPASIGDQAFIDNNGNGIYDAGDTPLANITVTLYRDGQPFATTSTGPDGTYLFDNLGPGNYRAEVDTTDPDLPGGLFATVTQYDETLVAGESYLSADFPFVNGLSKTVDKAYANPAGTLAERTLTFSLKPFYPGGDLLENVRVIDPLPTGTSYVSGSANAGGTFGAYTPIAAVPGNDPGPPILDTAMSVSTNFVNVGGSVNVTLNVKSSVAINNVSPTDLVVSGGAATCSGPTPASANLAANVGQNFVWSCTLTQPGEYIFSAGAEDAAETTSWPDASSASVLSAPHGGPNVVTWSLGSNAAGVPGEVIDAGVPAGVYAFRGATTNTFRRFNITSGTWVDRANALANIAKGGALTSDGVNTIYGLRGGGSQAFYSYAADTNSWTTLSNTGVNVDEGAALVYLEVGGVKYVYGLMGNGTAFRRYDIATPGWTAMRATPNNVKKGGALTTDGTYIYALRGDRKNTFWRCNATTDNVAGACSGASGSWTVMANVPGAVGWGGALTRLGGFIYALQGDGKKGFYRYNIANNQWTTLAATPGNVSEGGALTTDGTYIYAFQGKTTAFWRYDISTNKWTVLAAFSANTGQGGALTYLPAANLQGRVNIMGASPTLVSAGNTIQVRMVLQSSTAVNNVTPSALTPTATGGATASCTGPTPASQNIPAGGSAEFTWSCAVTPGANLGSLNFSASATGTAPAVSFPSATTNSVLVSPVLTFQTTVNTSGAPPVIENTGILAETSGAIGTLPSNTTQTATSGSIGDYVWADTDADGVQDGNEFGLAGVKVYVDNDNNGQWDTGEPYDITDASGLYRIYGLAAGAYTVRTDPATYPAGYLPATPTGLSVTLTAGQQYNDADFGLTPPGTGRIGDTIWLDADNDGVLDPEESGLPNIVVRLYLDKDNSGTVSAGDVLVLTTTTNAAGNYLFEGLAAGNYLVDVDESSTVVSPYDGNSYTLTAAMQPVFNDSPLSVSLSTGQVYLNADFGYNWSGSIGDLVWWDDDQSGTQNGSEAGIPNAAVLLYFDANNNGILDPAGGDYQIGFAMTDANGNYLFDNLSPGKYFVDVYEDSITTDGNRNIVPTTQNVIYKVLGPAENYLAADFGYYKGALVQGNVFHDNNRTATFDAGEAGLQGITVTLTGTDKFGNPVSATTTTDSSGHFVFVVPEGDYTLTYNTAQTTAFGFPDPTTPISFTFHAYPGENWYEHTSFDFGVDYSGKVGDRVWNDVNGNSSQDAGEPGLAGVTVNLYASDGTTWLAATATDAVGNYLFEGLADGTYVVKVNPATLPAGFNQTYDNTGGLDHTGQGIVSGGGSDLTADFGYKYTPAGGASVYTIAGFVWEDANGNGVLDTGESPIPGVQVTLACGPFGTYVVTTDTSTVNGNYKLDNVPDGTTCTITVNPATLPSAAYAQTGDPDVSPPACTGTACDNTTTVTVNGANPSLQNFGYQQQPGSISGTVCEGNGDGQCQPGESGIANVPVTLTWFGPDNILGTADDAVITTTTTITGFYIFTNLQPGLYQIVETNLPGYLSRADADGGNPDNISPVNLLLGGVITDQDFEDTRLGDVTVTKTLLLPAAGPATISDTVKFQIVVTNTGQSLLTTVPLWDYYSPACLENPVVTPGITVYIDNLPPSWTAPGGGGVYSAYYGPPNYEPVSPGTTAVYLGREAGIIKAGLTPDPGSGHYEDEGLFAFRPFVTIDAFAAGAVTYDVVNQEGTNPVWMTIEIDTGVVGIRSDNTTYQHVPTSNPTGWHTVDAGAGLWQKWNNDQGDVSGNPLITLSQVAAAHPGLDVVRVYLRLGIGDSYHGSGNGTVGWVDKATFGGVTYDFVVTGGGPGTGTNPALGVLHWPNLAPAGGLLPGQSVTVTVDFHANITEAMYWKEGGWEDYAPKGMPDFDQKQDQWFDPLTGKWFFCGPVAAANSLWWFDSKFEPNPVPPPTVNDGYNLVTAYGQWDDHDPANVQPFVGNLAGLMGTLPGQGTNVANMANGISTYLTQKGLVNDYTVTVLPKPPFEWVESEVRRSEDVILLLGFWQNLNPVGEPVWERVGGHFVTVAGVDSLKLKIAFSDPYRNAAEAGGLGRVLPNPHPYLHPAGLPDEVHNNAKYLSHDVYAFTPSPSPGGIWGPAGYAETCADIMNFAGQNVGDLPNGGPCQSGSPIFTEVEYAVAVSPKVPTVTCDPTTNIAVVSGAYDEFGLLLPEAQAHAQVRIVEEPAIGVAKRVVTPVVNNGDGTYTVEYSVLVQNVGNTVLNSVQVTDSLVATFTGAVSWNVVAGSISATGLTPNTNFDGSTDQNLLSGTDTLASLAQGTITFKVKVTPGSKLGTYYNTAVGSGVSPLGVTVTDVSQDGADTDPDTPGLTPADNPNPGDNSVPTPVDFTENPVIGLAKALDGAVVNNGDGTYVVTFTLTVKNYGDVILTNLVITDDIVTQFAGMTPTGFNAISGSLIGSGAAWNGTAGSNILQPGQSLAKGATGTVKIRFTVTPGYPRTVDNIAFARGTSPAGANVTDQSTVGTNPDPDNDTPPNPGDDSVPTPVQFTENPVIGIAKAVQGAVENLGGGQYRVTYLITVKNYGDVALSNVQVTDNLATTFTGATSWSVESVTSADFAVSGSYTGSLPNTSLLQGTDTLAVNASGTITLKVLVTPGANLGPYNNTAVATGDSPFGISVNDLSQNGTDPDPIVPPQTQPDGDPTNNNVPTPVTFTAITRIGVAKEVVLPVVNNGDGTYDVTYAIFVKNYGDTQLLGVQVTDNLNTTYGAGNFTVISKSATGLTINAGYNGNTNLNLLAGTDTLNQGQSGTITLVVRVAPGSNLGPYNNQARGTGTSPGGVPAADNSQNGSNPDPDGDGDPTNNNIPTPVTFTEAPAIGVAKRVVQPVVNNGDGTYTVEYSILVQNVGDIVLTNVQVTDDLAATFAGATGFSVIPGSISATGGLTANTGFDGTSDKNLLAGTDSLAKHTEGTITFQVKVTPGANLGPYDNSATGSGVSPAGTTVTDVSQDGLDTDPDTAGTTPADNPNPGDDSDPTPVSFTERPVVGLAKALKSNINNGDGTFTVAYTLTVKNYGDVELRNLQVTDVLTTTFAGASDFSVVSVTSPDFAVNAGYNGGKLPTPDSNLLAGADTLAVGAQGTITLTVKVTPGGNPGPYNNLATATAVSPAGTTVTDVSQNGLNPDPDGDGNPTNNTAETPVQFPERPVIGIAKAAISVVNNGNGTHTVTYLLTVENLGDVNLSNVQVTDNFGVTFPPPATFVVNSLTSAGFTVNPLYNGSTVTQMLAAGNTLAVGAIKTITVVVTVTPGTSTGPYNNSARADGVSPIGNFTYDISDNGTDPDPNGNGDPTDPGENDPTPVLFERPAIGAAKEVGTPVNNGDGTYDVTYALVIENLGDVALTNVQLTDNLNTTFGVGKFIVLSKSATGLTVNSGYNGDTDVNLLAAGQTLAVGGSATLTLVVRVTPGSNLGPYNNQAFASGTASGITVTDPSDWGTNPDPDGDKNADEPGENDPTPVSFTENPAIGVAKRVVSSANNGDGTFTVQYTIVVQNVGDVALRNVQVTDDLATTFATATSFSVTSISATGGLTANTNFNGVSDKNLLVGSDSLAKLTEGTITFSVLVRPAASPATYNNSATGSSRSPANILVTDVSTDGDDTDPDTGGKAPSDNPNPDNNSVPTPVTLTQTSGIAIVKTGPAVSYVGATAVYTYTVTNTGNVRLGMVTVTDDVCGSAAYVSGDDGDGYLEPGETWLFTCSYVVQANDPDPLINTATARGVDPLGQQKSATDDWTTDLVQFRIGDTVWLDVNGDTMPDPGEQGLYNVPVTVTGTDIDGGTVNITVYTDINGQYLVSLAKPGSYTVTTPVVFGGFQLTSPGAGGYNVTLTTAAPQELDADFGYKPPTSVMVFNFAAAVVAAGAGLQWEAYVPQGTLAPAFHVYRTLPGGTTWTKLTTDAPVGPVSLGGDILEYTFTDASAQRGSTYQYKLVDAEDPANVYGPYTVMIPNKTQRVFLPLLLR